MKDLQALEVLLSTPKNIVITTHANPDGDALGSSLGLSAFLKKRGHQVQVVTPTGYPDFLKWMRGNDEVIINQKSNHQKISGVFSNCQVIFCLDFSSLNRINDLKQLVEKSNAKIVLIDHHLNPDHFADFELWDTHTSSTAELIFDFIMQLNGKKEIDSAIAECLYAGIMTDTGSFKHSSTTAKTHRVAADLLEAGANGTLVNQLIYDTNSLNRLRFIGYALMEKLVVLEKEKVAYFVITAEEHERFHLKSGDTEGLVNYALSIKDVEIAAIILERDDEIKLSFRSLGNRAVNTFAADHFDGGGHKNAAGGHSNESLEATLGKFIGLVTEL